MRFGRRQDGTPQEHRECVVDVESRKTLLNYCNFQGNGIKMGQVCSGEKSESHKGGAFEDVTITDQGLTSSQFAEDSSSSQQQQQLQSQGVGDTVSSKEEAERLKLMREEQARLDLIVSAAGRGMVAVRSTRGSTGYYDQGFAAALAQHLEETTQFPDRLPVHLPLVNRTTSVYERLSQPQWEAIALGNSTGLAGCAGENPIRYMDNIAESLLDSVVPAKQQLFAAASPMVENLL